MGLLVERHEVLHLPVAFFIRKRLSGRFPGIQITVPPTLVLATDIFDRFIADNDLLDFACNVQMTRRSREPS